MRHVTDTAACSLHVLFCEKLRYFCDEIISHGLVTATHATRAIDDDDDELDGFLLLQPTASTGLAKNGDGRPEVSSGETR
jgi:hypothetical protein